MHDHPFAEFTTRWIALMTGAAHATTLLRQVSRQLPDLIDDDDALPAIVTRPAARPLPSGPDTRPRPATDLPPIAH